MSWEAAVRELCAAIPRPALPPPLPLGWEAAEAQLGAPVPPDLRALVEHYGAGSLGGLVDLLVPGDPRPAWNLVGECHHQSRTARSAIRGGRSLARNGWSFPLWFADGVVGGHAGDGSGWAGETPLAARALAGVRGSRRR